MTQGHIHSFESFGSVDGPGVRFVVFVQGCRMRCAYCHNPDTWKEDRGELMTPQAVLAKALRYRHYWGDNGGITVSGGEPLLQIDFVTELFSLAKKEGIHTTLDTSGEPFREDETSLAAFDRLMAVTDLVLLDVKEIDSEKHRKLTGKPLANILAFAKYLETKAKPVWIRHVLVPGWTDDDADLRALHDFIATLTNVEKTEVLPFHNLAQYKWAELGIPYRLKDAERPTEERIKNARRILLAAGD